MYISNSKLQVFPFPTTIAKDMRVLRYRDIVWGVSPGGKFHSSMRLLTYRRADLFTMQQGDGMLAMTAAHKLGCVTKDELRRYTEYYNAQQKKRREAVRWLADHLPTVLRLALPESEKRRGTVKA